jgi:hypothetical protein
MKKKMNVVYIEREKVLVGCFWLLDENTQRQKNPAPLQLSRASPILLFDGCTVDTNILRVCMMPFLMAAY